MIGGADGRLAVYWGVYDLKMRIGTARVGTADINLPVRHLDYRGRDLMPHLFAHSLAAMRASG